jgi:uncharacterized protein YjgD (DUF1641 family)
MARPIPLDIPPYDPHETLRARLENAPAEHAEALLSVLDIIQGMHDRGVLELIRGALGSSEAVMEIAVEAGRSEKSIRAIRNLLVMANLLADVNPETLKAITSAIPQSLEQISNHPEPASLWTLMKQGLWGSDTRRGLTAMATVLKTLGSNLESLPPK